MEIRILGTSTQKYINNLEKIKDVPGYFLLYEEGEKFCIYSNYKKEIILKFNTNVTRRQNIEVWEALGLINFNMGKITINYDSKNLLNKIKKNLLKKSSKPSLQGFKNTKMIAIEYWNGSLNDSIIKEFNIKQMRGTFNPEKLKNEISGIEKEIAKDPKFIIDLRKVLYNEII